MPISAASWPAKSGVSTNCEITGTRPNVAPSAKTAVSSGMPAAISDPNMIEQHEERGEQADELRRALALLAEAHELRAQAAVLDLQAPGRGPLKARVLHALEVLGLDGRRCRPGR